jgi:hypothetical protein
MIINAGTLQEDDYNEQHAEEQSIRSCASKGLSSDREVLQYYTQLGMAQTGAYNVLQVPKK